MPARWRAPLVRVALLAAFAGVVAVFYIPIGFNPTDEGMVSAQAYRLLHGGVPHVDIISPRPLGSALFHTIDFLLPMPLLDAWRAVAVVETLAYSAAFAALVFRRPFRDWGPVELALVGVATLVNINTFPLAAWHTRDGLLFAGVGLWLVDFASRRERPRLALGGLVVTGAAALMKQSFAPAAVLGLALWLWRSRASGRRTLLERGVIGAVAAGAPVVLYLAVLAVLGGAGEFLLQARSGKPPNGLELVDVLGSGDDANVRAVIAVVLVLAAAVLAFRLRDRSRAVTVIAAVIVTGAVTVALRRSPLSDGLHRPFGFWLAGEWSTVLWWLVAALVIARWEVSRRVDTAGVILLAAGYMTSLSWGITAPGFLGGSLLLYVIHRGWRPLLTLVRPAAVAVVALCVLTAAFAVQARRMIVNRDVPLARETFRLRSADADFGHARTNPTTGHYLSEAARCVRVHPSRWTAIIPDNAALYPILGLRNPFPIEWMFPPEIEHSEDQVVRAARRLDARGDYAVLVQRVAAGDLADANTHLDAVEQTRSVFIYPDTGAHAQWRVMRALTGTRESCGPFLLIWKPAATGA
jgi:hypothetical protein